MFSKYWRRILKAFTEIHKITQKPIAQPIRTTQRLPKDCWKCVNTSRKTRLEADGLEGSARCLRRRRRSRVEWEPRDLRPACSAPAPHASRARARQHPLAAGKQRDEARPLSAFCFEGRRCVMQACVWCARWTCSDGRSLRWQATVTALYNNADSSPPLLTVDTMKNICLEGY